MGAAAAAIRTLISADGAPPSLSVLPSILSALEARPPDARAGDQNPLLPSTLQPFSSHLSSPLLMDVISSPHCQKNPLSALHFFHWATAHFSPAASCFTAITDLLLFHRLFSAAESLLLPAAASSSATHHDFLAAKFISRFGDLGDIRRAVDWFHRRQSSLGRYSHNAILRVLVRANKVHLARAVFNQVPPNVSTYTTMIRGYCKLGLMADAETLFLNMACRPNLVTYNTLLQGYSMKGMMDSATATLAMMTRTQDCSPDVITFTTLINGFSRIGKIEKARALLEEMIERWNLKPNLVTYNAVISGLCAKEEFEKCSEMMARMRLDGIKPDVVTYSCMVKGLCAAGRVDEAAARLREMAAMTELELDSMAYGPVVKGYCKAGRLDEAMGVLDEMRKRSITPHVSLFNTLVAALVEISEVEKAAWLVKEMRRRGCKPSFLSYGFVVRGFCKRVGGMARAEALVVAMRRAGHCPDRRMYLDLADGYCREGDMGMVEKVLGDAAKEGFVLEVFDEMPARFRC